MILTNQLGYDGSASKKAVYQGKKEDQAGTFLVLDAAGKTVYEGRAKECGTVAEWNTGYYWELDFTPVREKGKYTISLDTAFGPVTSTMFEIQDFMVTFRLMNAAAYYFKAQRISGEWLEADKSLKFEGDRQGRVDLHGGWYDATGDYGVHLSHLSHGSIHNPQQAAFSAYAFFRSLEWLEESGNEEYSMLKRRLLDEGTWGADFLMRLRAPSGTFFRSVNRDDSLVQVRDTRFVGLEYHGSSTQFSKVAETADSETITDANYEVSLRSGGGMAIAALAAAARHYYPGTDYSQADYLLAAKDAWAYLSKHNEPYTNDGEWNLIDEYCALTALTELYRSTGEYEYLYSAAEMAERIKARMVTDEKGETAYLTLKGEIPFYHASDEGLPVVALLEYAGAELNRERAAQAVDVAELLMRGLLKRTKSCTNPFGYPRMLCQRADGKRREQFFFPHDTAVAPWWQGDNARLSSLSAAARRLARVTGDQAFAAELEEFSDNQINWIMGLNPFDACMMEGYGRNNIQYFFDGRMDFINCPGGICNGITSGLDNEEGIAFVSEYCEEVTDNWRWAEQWVPHVSWFLCAQAAKGI